MSWNLGEHSLNLYLPPSRLFMCVKRSCWQCIAGYSLFISCLACKAQFLVVHCQECTVYPCLVLFQVSILRHSTVIMRNNEALFLSLSLLCHPLWLAPPNTNSLAVIFIQSNVLFLFLLFLHPLCIMLLPVELPFHFRFEVKSLAAS